MKEESRLKKAFDSGLGLEPQTDYSALEFSKTAYWDSIAHMRLVAAIEEEFGIRLKINDILGMSSYKVAKEIVQKYLAQ